MTDQPQPPQPGNTEQTAGPAGPLDSDHEPGRTAGDSPAANQRAGEEPVPGDLGRGDDATLGAAVLAAAGTSEETAAADGVTTTAIAQPGKPDGEPAT